VVGRPSEIALLKPPVALKSRGHLWGAIGSSDPILFLSSVPMIALQSSAGSGARVLIPLFGAAAGAVCIASAIRWDAKRPWSKCGTGT
jgi:hypothetical protein